jgi:phosphopantothenoylcysteine decarboxylase/phosphopantothenate--cysteine ligase
VLTPGATHFISPLTFEALTGNPAGVEIWDEQPGTSRMGHLELARWAELLVLAPASAGAIARLALGLAGDLLGAVALAAQAPILIAPAMESAMYRHRATQEHLRTLQSRGATVIGPESGRLASGSVGEGRMSEPLAIVEAIESLLQHRQDLEGYNILITAGPTFEAIDPVRYIGNRSSGKMGFALAKEAGDRGGEVLLISGPTALEPSVPVIPVESAADMRRAVLDRAAAMDVIVMCAAVSDFRPIEPLLHKQKRAGKLTLELEPTPDIAAAAVAAAPQAFHIGFALETDNLLASAREKMISKGQNLVVANALTADHNPFGSDENLVTLLTPSGEKPLPRMSKTEIARVIWDEVIPLLPKRTTPR